MQLYRPVGQAEYDLVAGAGWRAWPRLPGQPEFRAFTDLADAAEVTRERDVAADGAGYVLEFEIPDDSRAPEYVIPAAELAVLNAQLTRAIVQQADYRAGVSEQEFARAAEVLGRPLPAAWHSYLCGPSWFRRGWLATGEYVWLYPPGEMLGLQDAWGESTALHPGIAIIGGDGGREQFALDLRQEPAPVLLIEISSGGWDGAVRQAADVGEFIERVEAGTFDII